MQECSTKVNGILFILAQIIGLTLSNAEQLQVGTIVMVHITLVSVCAYLPKSLDQIKK